MKLTDVIEKLGATEIYAVPGKNPEIVTVCAADFLSDILAAEKRQFVILTGFTSPQVIRTADVVGALAVIFVRGKYPPPETIGLAKAHDIPLYVSPLPMFESCVRLAEFAKV
jgi:hypothetical protein